MANKINAFSANGSMTPTEEINRQAALAMSSISSIDQNIAIIALNHIAAAASSSNSMSSSNVQSANNSFNHYRFREMSHSSSNSILPDDSSSPRLDLELSSRSTPSISRIKRKPEEKQNSPSENISHHSRQKPAKRTKTNNDPESNNSDRNPFEEIREHSGSRFTAASATSRQPSSNHTMRSIPVATVVPPNSIIHHPFSILRMWSITRATVVPSSSSHQPSSNPSMRPIPVARVVASSSSSSQQSFSNHTMESIPATTATSSSSSSSRQPFSNHTMRSIPAAAAASSSSSSSHQPFSNHTMRSTPAPAAASSSSATPKRPIQIILEKSMISLMNEENFNITDLNPNYWPVLETFINEEIFKLRRSSSAASNVIEETPIIFYGQTVLRSKVNRLLILALNTLKAERGRRANLQRSLELAPAIAAADAARKIEEKEEYEYEQAEKRYKEAIKKYDDPEKKKAINEAENGVMRWAIEKDALYDF